MTDPARLLPPTPRHLRGRRFGLALVAVLAAVLAVAMGSGCGRSERSAARADAENGVVRLTYWSSQNPQERALADTLVRRWNAAHPGVQVTLQPIPAGQSSEEVLLAAIVGRTTPDLCSNVWPGILADFVRARGVVRLDTMPGFEATMARVPEALRGGFVSADGGTYQIPWKTNPILMLVNRGMLREAGVAAIPRTYSEYLAAATRVTADTDGDGQRDRWMGYRDTRPIWWQRYFDVYPLYIAASGGRTYFDARGRLDVDTLASDAVFGFFQTLFARGDFPRTTFQGNPFVEGKIATEFTGPWSAADLAERAPPGLDYAYAPLPVPDGTPPGAPVYTYGDYKNIALFSTSRHPREAWAFAQYLVSEEADRLLVRMTRQMPLRSGIADDPALADFYAANPAVRPFALAAEATRGVDAVPQLPEVLDAVSQAFERAVYGAETPREATQSALRRIALIQSWSTR